MLLKCLYPFRVCDWANEEGTSPAIDHLLLMQASENIARLQPFQHLEHRAGLMVSYTPKSILQGERFCCASRIQPLSRKFSTPQASLNLRAEALPASLLGCLPLPLTPIHALFDLRVSSFKLICVSPLFPATCVFSWSPLSLSDVTMSYSATVHLFRFLL